MINRDAKAYGLLEAAGLTDEELIASLGSAEKFPVTITRGRTQVPSRVVATITRRRTLGPSKVVATTTRVRTLGPSRVVATTTRRGTRLTTVAVAAPLAGGGRRSCGGRRLSSQRRV